MNNKITIEKLKSSIPHRLDSLKFTNFHLWVIVSLGVSWIIDGFEVSLLSVLSGVLKIVFKMDDSEIGKAGSFYLLGCVSGSLLFGFLAAKWGRKVLFSTTLGIYTLSIIFTAISVNKYMFFACRFMTGVGVGGEYSSIFAVIDELLPPNVRGRADLIIDGTWHLGSTIASVLSYLTLYYFPISQDFKIRLLFIIGALVAFPVCYLRKNIPESPRWLLHKGKYKDALIVVEKIEEQCQIKNEKYSTILGGEVTDRTSLMEKSMSDSKYKNLNNEKIKEITFTEIFITLIKKHRIRFLYGVILMASQAFFYNGIFYTYTLVLQNFYKISKETVGLYLIPISVASFIGPIFIGKFFDSWSRRKMIGLTYIGTGILLIITATNFILGKLGFVVQQILWFITFFVASPAASSAHLTVSEIFPVEIRSQAMAIFFSIGLGTGGVIAPFLYGSFIQEDNKFKIFLSYLLASFIMMSAGVFGLLKGVDAENKSLEEINENLQKEEEEINEI